MYLWYLLRVVAPMQEISPRQGRFRMRPRRATLRRAGADQEWISSMKTIRSWLPELLQDPLAPSNWPRYGAGHDQGEVEGHDPLVGEEDRHLPWTTRWARPDDGGLPPPGSPSRIVVLVRRERI
jgi:hypothetical protein